MNDDKRASLKRLEELCQLEANWDGDGAKPIHSEVLAIAREALLALSMHLSDPALGAVEDGRLDLSWEREDIFVTLDVDTVRIHASKDRELRDVPLKGGGVWARVGHFFDIIQGEIK